MNDCIGLDISKRLIAVHIPKNSLDIEINNNITGMKKLISKLKKLYKDEYKDLVFIFEPTGHTSKKFKDMLPIWKAKNLTVFYLPPYSPELNPIEMVWKFMKYYWIELNAYKSATEMKKYVEKVIQGYGTDYEIKFA